MNIPNKIKPISEAAKSYKSWKEFKEASRKALLKHTSDEPFGAIKVSGIPITLEAQIAFYDWVKENNFKNEDEDKLFNILINA